MKKILVVLFGVLAVGAGSAQAEWIKHEDRGATGKDAGFPRSYFNQAEHSDLDGFVRACKTKCENNSDTCGGFIVDYATSDKSRPAYCTYKDYDNCHAEGFTYWKTTNDFYQVVTQEYSAALAKMGKQSSLPLTQKDAERQRAALKVTDPDWDQAGRKKECE